SHDGSCIVLFANEILGYDDRDSVTAKITIKRHITDDTENIFSL
ncbi:1401_t:CDS:1, partial [Funneliformis caledonium]